MNVSFEYYRIFYYVAKYRSFTKAANVLGSNQPNITRTMNRLEEQTGCKLFVRSNRGVLLTPEGERLLSHVEVALEHFQAGEAELEASADLRTGSISIGTSETALYIFLMEKLSQFHRRYPGIRLKITNHSVPEAVAALERGLVDLAVVTTPTNLERPLQQQTLTSFQEILICGAEFQPLSQRPFHLKEIEQYPLIMLSRDTMTYTFYNRLFLRHNVILEPDTEVATTDQVLPLVRHGLGLGFLSQQMAAGALERSEVFQVPLQEPVPRREVVLIRDPRHPLSAAARELTRIITE